MGVLEKLNEYLNDEKLKIVFANPTQAFLYKNEIAGQLSDGYWENANPNGHWRDMTAATISWSPNISEQGVFGFRPKRAYNFSNAELLDVVGDRMLFMARVKRAYPSKDDKEIRTLNILGSIDVERMFADSRWQEHLKEIKKVLGVESDEEVKSFVDKLKDNSYTMLSLKVDLKRMSEIVNKAYRK